MTVAAAYIWLTPWQKMPLFRPLEFLPFHWWKLVLLEMLLPFRGLLGLLLLDLKFRCGRPRGRNEDPRRRCQKQPELIVICIASARTEHALELRTRYYGSHCFCGLLGQLLFLRLV